MPRGQGGAGGHGVGPGAGGDFPPIGVGGTDGDANPRPQAAGVPPDCNMIPETPCYEKCVSDWDLSAAICARIKNESDRWNCMNLAYQDYNRCRELCVIDDCRKACIKQCEWQHHVCEKNCGKDRQCKGVCLDALKGCLKQCDKDCK